MWRGSAWGWRWGGPPDPRPTLDQISKSGRLTARDVSRDFSCLYLYVNDQEASAQSAISEDTAESAKCLVLESNQDPTVPSRVLCIVRSPEFLERDASDFAPSILPCRSNRFLRPALDTELVRRSYISDASLACGIPTS